MNIGGTYHLYEAARQAHVKRIVFASSVHAVGFYEQLDVIDASVPQRPDTLYGLSKAFGEDLARLYWISMGWRQFAYGLALAIRSPSIAG